jgi:hypothetical protein
MLYDCGDAFRTMVADNPQQQESYYLFKSTRFESSQGREDQIMVKTRLKALRQLAKVERSVVV